MPLDKQQRIIDIMRANPEAGYAFFGPSGWSKSTFMYALFRAALRRQCDLDFSAGYSGLVNRYNPCVFVSASRLMDDIEAWKYKDGPHPIITDLKIDRMRTRGVKFSVYLDEFEKIRKSPFRMEESYKIIEALYKARDFCQLVIAGNMSKEDLEDRNQYMEGTPRRIEALTSPHFWDFGGQ
ncbi:MAG TPA: hypothetical protein VMI10_24920 [Terriglobales bacterium]|nr:hypothetical protein [Terriglobales bacterium]